MTNPKTAKEENEHAWRQDLLELNRKTTEMEKRLDRILDDNIGKAELLAEEGTRRRSSVNPY